MHMENTVASRESMNVEVTVASAGGARHRPRPPLQSPAPRSAARFLMDLVLCGMWDELVRLRGEEEAARTIHRQLKKAMKSRVIEAALSEDRLGVLLFRFYLCSELPFLFCRQRSGLQPTVLSKTRRCFYQISIHVVRKAEKLLFLYTFEFS